MEQADDAFLNEVTDRQAVVLKAPGGGDHQTVVGVDQFMERCIVAFVAPGAGESVFVLAGQERRLHRPLDKGDIRAAGFAVFVSRHDPVPCILACAECAIGMTENDGTTKCDN